MMDSQQKRYYRRAAWLALAFVSLLTSPAACRAEGAAPAAPSAPTSSTPTPLSATPLGADTIFAGQDVDVHFFLARRDRPGTVFRLMPVPDGPLSAEITMPSMPGMAPIMPGVHNEGAPGYFGLTTIFPHGGRYRIAITTGDTAGPSSTGAFTVDVQDAPENGAPPRPLFSASVRTAPETAAAGQPAELHLTVNAWGDKRAWTDFVVVHEKPWHLLVMSHDLRWFDHIHPQPQPDGTWTVTETFPAGGDYLLLSDVSPRGYGQQFLPVDLHVTGAAFPSPYRLAVSPTTVTVSGLTVRLDAPSPLPAHKDLTLTFHVSTPDGKPATDLQPYLGAMGHLVLVDETRTHFVHSHPAPKEGPQDGVVPFLVRFPRPGLYKAWAQFQRDGKVITADFVVKVEDAAR